MSIKLQSIYGNCQPKKSNIIVEVVYRHPSMNLADFNYIYLNKLLWNISKQQKSFFQKFRNLKFKILNQNFPTWRF